MFIYLENNWPNFTWQHESLMTLLGAVRNMQGQLIGKMDSLGFALRSEASLETLTLDILKSNEIEGELLNSDQVRSSLARRLGLDVSGTVHSGRDVDGVVEMMVDATQKYDTPLTEERLCNWHGALFPTGRSGMLKIGVGKWRDDTNGPMQIVSGAIGNEQIHFQAPNAASLPKEMGRFFKWFNEKQDLDPILKAGIAHFWFVTIHPFEDGNGRIARAITDMLLARSDGIAQRFYSMSAQIQIERKKYYDTLELSQKGSLNITEWLVWFLECLMNGLLSSEKILTKVLLKHQFWNKNSKHVFNDRQIPLLNKMLEGFSGKLTSSKWAKISKCSPDTALRDITDLIKKGVLKKELAGGRSTSYVLQDQ